MTRLLPQLRPHAEVFMLTERPPQSTRIIVICDLSPEYYCATFATAVSNELTIELRRLLLVIDAFVRNIKLLTIG